MATMTNSFSDWLVKVLENWNVATHVSSHKRFNVKTIQSRPESVGKAVIWDFSGEIKASLGSECHKQWSTKKKITKRFRWASWSNTIREWDMWLHWLPRFGHACSLMVKITLADFWLLSDFVLQECRSTEHACSPLRPLLLPRATHLLLHLMYRLPMWTEHANHQACSRWRHFDATVATCPKCHC